MKKPSVQDKIEILKKVKHELIHGKDMKFICTIFSAVTNCNFEIHEEISIFKVENAIMICEKYKLKKPSGSYAWWNSSEVKARLAFVNWMIKELKKEL